MSVIAILGFGTVGSGVYEVFKNNPEIEIRYIVDLRTFPDHPLADRVTKEFDKVLSDPDVKVVVETMGGVNIARDYTQKALRAGKSVVTSNKAVVDACGEELEALARENGVSYLYEASVGGGIPIIRPLQRCYNAEKICKISGILNGTTNYILTQMEQTGDSMENTLKQAQALGYAEQDPTADIEGLDSARKICILASLAFGMYIPYTAIPHIEGIRSVTGEDIACAKNEGFAVKLLGNAELCDGKIRLTVAPHLVPTSCLLHAVGGAFNAISVYGDMVGETLFYGSGAGSLPTAAAVCNDVLEALQTNAAKPAPCTKQPFDPSKIDPDGEHKTYTLKNGKTFFLL